MSGGRRYLLDITRLIWRRWSGRLPTGIDRVCLAYLDAFAGESQAVIQRAGVRRILSPATSDRVFDLLRAPREDLRAPLAAALAAAFVDPRNARSGEGRLYLNIGHTGLNDPGFAQWVERRRLRPVHFVHDLIPITDPQYCREGEAERHRKRIRAALSTAVGIIANSRATLEALGAFERAEGLPSPPRVAAHLGCDLARPAQLRAEAAGPATFVILGTIEARKNHLMLLDIWRGLVAELGARAPRLTIIGQRGWEAREVFDMLDSGSLAGVVSEVGRCDDAALAEHLAGARALLFPSLAEGYGLPLVEALATGTPVIASDLAVFREIAGDIPTFVPAGDAPRWRQAILDFAEPSSAARQSQLGRLAAFAAPSWADHFATVRRWLGGLQG